MEVDLNLLKKMSAEYAEAKNVAIKGIYLVVKICLIHDTFINFDHCLIQLVPLVLFCFLKKPAVIGCPKHKAHIRRQGTDRRCCGENCR
jgi:hypothetical protein